MMMILMNHSFGGGSKGKPGAKGQETDGDLHIVNQLRKIIDMEMPMEVHFLDRSRLEVNLLTAAIVMEQYDNLRTSIQKEEMMNEIWLSSEVFEELYETNARVVEEIPVETTVSEATEESLNLDV